MVTVLVVGGLASIPSGAAGRDLTTPAPSTVSESVLPSSAEAAPAGVPQWFDVTTNLTSHSGDIVPAVGFGSAMAYDPLLSELVLFNGCSETQCPGNDTWTYNGMAWTNITGTLATSPSARDGAGLSYDPSLGGLVLFGGVNSTGGSDDDTWLFTGSGWANITDTVGVPTVAGTPLPWSYGGMAWDPALDGIVVVDGCAVANCITTAEVYGITLLLTASGWSYYEAGPGTDTNLTYLSYNSLAYDYASNELVEFGGYDYYHGYSNYTFTMNSSGVWVNVTNDDAGCAAGTCYTPQGRVSTAMTWDGQLGGVFMAEGYNGTTDEWLNDSWLFMNGAWYPTTLVSPSAPSSFCASAWPSMSTVSDDVAPFILGGYSPDGASCPTTEWVFEVPPQATLTAVPHPADLGATVTFTASWVAGTGSGIVAGWNISYGNGNSFVHRGATAQNSSTPYSQDASYAYPATGTFSATATWTDFFYVSGTSAPVSVTVYPALVATISASATTISAGGAVTFSTAPTGGSGSYTYAWAFGDGTTSAVQAPGAHTYSKAGTYTVDLTVTDSTGSKVSATVTITVNPAPSTGLSPTDTYAVIGVVIAVVAILAAVLLLRRRKKPTSAQPWQPGAPAAGTAPPAGVMGESPPPPPLSLIHI